MEQQPTHDRDAIIKGICELYDTCKDAFGQGPKLDRAFQILDAASRYIGYLETKDLREQVK